MPACVLVVLFVVLGRAFQLTARAQPQSQETGVIVGTVVDEHDVPVPRAQVQAFSTDAVNTASGSSHRLARRAGSASTDAAGVFRISGLSPGDYIVAAEAMPAFPDGGSTPARMYGPTFYPSTLDASRAFVVHALGDTAAPVQIALVLVTPVRVTGGVTSASGRSTEGFDVKLFRRFGDFGNGAALAVVDARGSFEIPRVPPGAYRLTIEPRGSRPGQSGREFVDTLIDVNDHDLVLTLTAAPAASLTGHVAEPSGDIATPVDDTTQSSAALVEQFKNETVFWKQFEIARAITAKHDANVLPPLVDWLGHTDRHLRGNVAFIFASLGDPRGLQTIADILSDRSERPPGQGISAASSDGRYRFERQVAADRYYAAHLLGDVRDPRGIALLVPLLDDPATRSIAPWSLARIGDRNAIPPLVAALDSDDPSTRVLVIYALEMLQAKEAVPRLASLVNDNRRSRFGALVTVSEAAKAAIAKLQ